jgi:hypothetical protein
VANLPPIKDTGIKFAAGTAGVIDTGAAGVNAKWWEQYATAYSLKWTWKDVSIWELYHPKVSKQNI